MNEAVFLNKAIVWEKHRNRRKCLAEALRTAPGQFADKF
ncbi:hypothetical protein AmDm5_0883 [Acetobacter malorum]|nr:hypothetical protein AmDm5_0883 [Acetobacter malorum]